MQTKILQAIVAKHKLAAIIKSKKRKSQALIDKLTRKANAK